MNGSLSQRSKVPNPLGTTRRHPRSLPRTRRLPDHPPPRPEALLGPVRRGWRGKHSPSGATSCRDRARGSRAGGPEQGVCRSPGTTRRRLRRRVPGWVLPAAELPAVDISVIGATHDDARIPLLAPRHGLGPQRVSDPSCLFGGGFGRTEGTSARPCRRWWCARRLVVIHSPTSVSASVPGCRHVRCAVSSRDGDQAGG
jgi:hypothetical protein